MPAWSLGRGRRGCARPFSSWHGGCQGVVSRSGLLGLCWENSTARRNKTGVSVFGSGWLFGIKRRREGRVPGAQCVRVTAGGAASGARSRGRVGEGGIDCSLSASPSLPSWLRGLLEARTVGQPAVPCSSQRNTNGTRSCEEQVHLTAGGPADCTAAEAQVVSVGRICDRVPSSQEAWVFTPRAFGCWTRPPCHRGPSLDSASHAQTPSHHIRTGVGQTAGLHGVAGRTQDAHRDAHSRSLASRLAWLERGV